MPLKKFSQDSSETLTSGIAIELYHDHGAAENDKRLLFKEYEKEFLAEDLCLEAAKKLGITPVSFHLFGLVDPDSEIWLPPNAPITCRKEALTRYTFRLRLYPQVGPELLSKRFDREAFNYFFLQCRHDFVNDRISYQEKKQDKILGLGVVDMVRQAKEKNTSLSELKKLDPTPFIPSTLSRKSFKLGEYFHRTKLKLNIEPHLQSEWEEYKENQGVPVLKLRYLIEIKTLAKDFGVEVFQTASRDEAYVEPCHERFPGICFNRGRDGENYFAAIEDLSDISIAGTSVQINRKNGIPKFIPLKTEEAALSMVSLLDGYYRMMVDYHFHLCNAVESPMVRLLNRTRAFGPVRKPWAVNRLEQKHQENPSVNYLLKQKRDDFDTFRLYVWREASTWKEPFNIHRLQSGKFQLEKNDEPLFNSLPQLLLHYKSGKHPSVRLIEGVRPNQWVDNWLYLCRPKFEDPSDFLPDHQHQQQRSKVTLVSDVNIIPGVARPGYFTEVLKGLSEKENSVQQVAVKQLSAGYKTALLEPFTHGINRALFWSNSGTVATIYALCLSPPFRVLMEYADLGSLVTFLQSPQANLKVYHLLNAAEQMAQALLYLQEETGLSEEGEVHGNFRARNVLVFSLDKDVLRVKLGDPGLVHLYNSQPLENMMNLERLPWVAPELFADLTKMTIFSDRYAFGTLLWETFSSGDHPFANFDAQMYEEEIQAVRKSHDRFHLDCPEQAPKEVFSIIEKCWDSVPENRMPPKDIVRDIRSLLHNAPSSSEYHYPISMNVNPHAFDNQFTPEKKNLFDLLKQNVTPSSMPGKVPGFPHDSFNISTDSRAHLQPRALGASNATHMNAGLVNGTAVPQTTQLAEMSRAHHGEAASLHPFNKPLPPTPHMGAQIPGHVDRDCLESIPDPSAKLGEGYYGQVHKAYLHDPCTKSKQLVAVKSLKNHSGIEASLQEFEKEFQTMAKLEHENIVKLIGQCPSRSDGAQPDKPMLLVMEYIEKGSLKGHLQTYKSQLSQTPETLLKYIKDVAEGMKYLSSKNVIHRDLAVRNILVTKEERMKISDFGLSRILDPKKDYYKANPGKNIPALWCAPECLLENKFSIESDVWSFGVTVWEVYSLGKQPQLCEQFDQILKTLHSGKRLEKPEICPTYVYTLMKHCWEYEVKKRMDFQQICETIAKIKDKLGYQW